MERPDWTTYFLNICEVVATRSIDPNTKVGCVITNNHRIMSTGYNGPPPGINDKSIPLEAPDKYKFFVHAEANAIIHAKCDLSDCYLYCTHSPCPECCKLIAAAGIRGVFFRNLHPSLDKDLVRKFKLCFVWENHHDWF